MFLKSPVHQMQRGISLIESLIAMVVMALGILGMLGVQMRTLTDTQGGVRRAQAIRLIEDLGERLQNNPDALSNLSTYTTEPSSSTDCVATPCSPSQLATFDIKNWRTAVENTLPGGKATVFVPQDSPRQLGVLIGWSENRYNQDGKSRTVADTTALEKFLQDAVSGGKDATGAAVSCPVGLICHLQYVQPTQRCTPWTAGGGALYCPN